MLGFALRCPTRGEWYTYDLYTKSFKGIQSYGIDTLLQMEPTKYVTNLMPRLNVAFPITENAKLYFNYGHLRGIPTPENLYLVRRETETGNILYLANPNLPLERTVVYELGYEHNLFDMFHLRVASYYKDISAERFSVNYVGYNNVPNYSTSTSNAYEDIRGFEITLRKNRGNWIQGFVNYSYMVATSGYFGWARYYQNPVDQRNYERVNPVQSKPLPRPYPRANIDLFTPSTFGPNYAGMNPLADWRLSILASWSTGAYTTWVGGGSVPGVTYNLQWRDNYGCDIRLSKSFQIGPANVMLFMDVNNVFNLKQLTPYGFYDNTDYEQYLKSLHLPGGWDLDKNGQSTIPKGFNTYYGNIPGDDRPGDYRKAGAEYQPMVYSENVKLIQAPYARPIYFDHTTMQYYRWINNAWQVADQGEVDRVLKDRAYIHMPTQDWNNFLNPRDFYFGVRMSFDVF